MKYLSSACLAALLAFTGCTSGTAGGPGATGEQDERFAVGQPNDTFQLSRGKASIKQGETKSVSIGIDRSTNFDQDVTLLIADLPRGLSIDIAKPKIGAGDTEARFALTAAADASLGDFSITVTGRPANGGDASNKLDITVTKD